jgi:parallel beta-helix repeat protein
VELSYGSGNTLNNNEILNNTLKGLYINNSGGNVLRENNIAGSPVNFDLNGTQLSEYKQDIDISNTVDGKPIYYLVDKNDAAIGSSTNAGCVFVVNCTDVVVYDLELSNNGTGVVFAYTANSNIENVTTVNNSRTGILLQSSTNNRLIGNNVSNNNYGIQLLNSGNDTLRNNVCTDNLYNFVCEGGTLADYQHDIDVSNTVDGRPIYYLVGKYSATVDSASIAGCVFAVNCSNITVRDLTVSNNGTGVAFVGTSNSSIENVTATGNDQAGILLFNSTNTTLQGCGISRNSYGVSLLGSNYALLQSNFIFENRLGVSCNMGSLNLINSIIKNNSDEGGVAFFDNSIGSVVNCTIYGNAGQGLYYPYGGGGVSCDYSSSVTVSSSIIWANRPNQITDDTGGMNVTVKYSDIQGQFQGIGNIDANPLITPDGHLCSGSPCINKGEPYVVYTRQDMDGEKRVHGATVDIGADEFIDTDGNGLPDWWENTYFNPNDITVKPGEDPDDDGYTNLNEYEWYSSDPTMPCAIYYVDANQPGDGNGGQSWETAKKTIQAAIEIAENSDKVLVAPGLYNQNVSTLGRQIVIQSADPVDPTVVASTIIDGGLSIDRGELQGCVISGLTVSNQYGTGILCDGTSPTISNCTITGNRNYSWEQGGGVTCFSASPVIANCVINGNVSPERGNGLYCQNSALTITNSVISGNVPDYGSGQGTAIYASNSNLEVHRCTIANNEYPDSYSSYGSVIYCEQGDLHLDNSILWNNMDLQISCDDTIVTVTYSDIKGGRQGIQAYWDGYGNIDVDPCFVSIGYWTEPPYYYNASWVGGDYHLQSQGWRWIPNITHGTNWVWDGQTSLCVDAGNPGTELGDEMLTVSVDPNNEWGRNVRVNMGAYGGTAQASMAPHNWAILGDLTNDGTLDFTDFTRWVDNTMFWMIDENRGDCPADLDRNVSVNMADLALLAQDWLAQTSWFGTNMAIQPPPLPPSPPPKGRSCFLADTPVWVDGALVQISKVVLGQTVGKVGCAVTTCLEKIEKFEEHEGTFECRDITLENGNRISVVDAHCFMLDSGQWVAAQNLQSGMKLKSLNGAVAIKSVVTRAMPFVGKVYNLKVNGSDRYMVGKDGVIVRDY